MIFDYVDDNTREILEKKGSRVRNMFDRIAPWYDFLNHFLSLGIDRYWREKMIRRLKLQPEHHVLDMATGTGDLAITLVRNSGCSVTGMDVSEKMMTIAERKVREKGLQHKISFLPGAAEHIPFESGKFDVVVVAFGVRNFTNLDQGLKEMLRVLKPGGQLAILEFSKPVWQPLKAVYSFYLFHVLPLAGRIFSGDKYAYTYLPVSIKAFPQREVFLQIMQNCGYEVTWYNTYTGGIVTAYYGKKPVK